MRCYICDHSPDAGSVLRDGEVLRYNNLTYLKDEGRWVCSECQASIRMTDDTNPYAADNVIVVDFDKED